MKIVFVSFIDSSNIGDLLIVKVLEKELMEPDSVSKYSFNLVPEKEIFVNNVIIANNKAKSLIKGIYNDFFRKLDIIDRMHTIKIKRMYDKSKYLSLFERDIKSCDLLVIGGGNAIFDLTPHSLSAYKIHILLDLARKYNKKTFITSIGIGPFQTQKQIDFTVRTLEKADYITVRDKKSYNYLESINSKVYLSIDPVFLLENGSYKDRVKNEKVISICVIDLLLNKNSNKVYKQYIDNYTDLVNKLILENYIINLYSTEPKDYRAVKDVYQRVHDKTNVSLVYINNFTDLMSLYESTDLIIGTRMHSLIIGLSQLIPVIGLSWQDKVEGMFEMINYSGDVYKIKNLKQNIPSIIKKVNEKINNDSEGANLEIIKKENHNRFKVNIQLIEKIKLEISNQNIKASNNE